MNLYIDIGNTNIKMTYLTNDKKHLKSFITTQEFTVDQLYEMLPSDVKKSDLANVWIVSVVPKKDEIFAHVFKKYFDIKVRTIEFPIKTGIQINVDRAKSVGSDIICLSAFVANETKNGIIVNAGTATTITHVQEDTMKGTIIIPGLTLSYESLIKGAKKIGDIKLALKKDIIIGKNTEEAISLGVIKGHVHMIDSFIKDIDPEADVYLSGGNSIYLKELLPKFKYVKEATLRGAMVIADRNKK